MHYICKLFHPYHPKLLTYNHVVQCLGPRMADSIAGLIKTLNEKYEDLCNKEADYLAASDTRRVFLVHVYMHFNFHQSKWHWTHDKL